MFIPARLLLLLVMVELGRPCWSRSSTVEFLSGITCRLLTGVAPLLPSPAEQGLCSGVLVADPCPCPPPRGTDVIPWDWSSCSPAGTPWEGAMGSFLAPAPCSGGLPILLLFWPPSSATSAIPCPSLALPSILVPSDPILPLSTSSIPISTHETPDFGSVGSGVKGAVMRAKQTRSQGYRRLCFYGI